MKSRSCNSKNFRLRKSCDGGQKSAFCPQLRISCEFLQQVWFERNKCFEKCKQLFVLPKTRKSGLKTINFVHISFHLGNSIILNKGLLSIHRYLIRLFLTPHISNVLKNIIQLMQFPRFQRLLIQFFVIKQLFLVGESTTQYLIFRF